MLTDLDAGVLGVVHHGAGQRVEAHEVGEPARAAGVLHHVALDDVLLRDEPVQHVRRREYRGQVELLKVGVEQDGDSLHIRRLEHADPRGLGRVRQFVELEMPLHCHVPEQWLQFNIVP